MRWGTVLSGMAAALFAGPSYAETPSPRVSATVARSFQMGWDGDAPRPVMRFALTDRMELVATGRKEKPPGEQVGRRNEGPAGRPRNPKMARIGVILHW